MSKEIKMSTVWGWGAVPQNYTKFNGFKHDNGDYSGDCYGLLFLTEEAAEAQAHALRNHDRLVEEKKRLREAVRQMVAEFGGDHLCGDSYALMCKVGDLLSGLGGE